MCFFSKSWRNVLIDVVSVSRSAFKNNPWKIFSSNLKKAPFSLLSHKSKTKWWRTVLHTVKSNMGFTCFSSMTFYISEDGVFSPGNSEGLWLLTALWLLDLEDYLQKSKLIVVQVKNILIIYMVVDWVRFAKNKLTFIAAWTLTIFIHSCS